MGSRAPHSAESASHHTPGSCDCMQTRANVTCMRYIRGLVTPHHPFVSPPGFRPLVAAPNASNCHPMCIVLSYCVRIICQHQSISLNISSHLQSWQPGAESEYEEVRFFLRRQSHFADTWSAALLAVCVSACVYCAVCPFRLLLWHGYLLALKLGCEGMLCSLYRVMQGDDSGP